MDYKEAIERSKIPRINWKLVLGKSLTAYLRDNRYKSDDDLMHEILLKVRERPMIINQWYFPEIVKNLKIGISARRAEQKIYG